MKGLFHMLDLPASLPAPTNDTIIVTASRLPETPSSTAASVSVVDHAEIERLGSPMISDYLRLLPSMAVSVSGPAGSQTDVRIRGAEANHTLLFIDGIRANDPAAGNTPRFELLNADLASRIEVVRGPQSALWGSEAIGGVVAVEGDPGTSSSLSAMGEVGSFATYRGSASGSYVGNGFTAALAIAGQKSRGTDAFGGPASRVGDDKDGYDNASLRGRLTWQAAPKVELGVSGFATSALSQYDGYSPVTFLHADTLDNTRNRLGAVRGWVSAGAVDDALSATVSASLLGSSNINRLGEDEINRTRADRRTLSAELRHHSKIGELDQHIVLAAEQEDENFHARDIIYGGYSNQDRDRRHRSVTLEYKGEWRALTGDLAVRRDTFNRFRDATTVRASLLAKLGGGFELAGSYGEGIAQPTFFDLYGFFPGSFVGNPDVVPESSRGGEASVRWRNARWTLSLTAYRQRLRNEIVGTYDPATFLSSTANATGISHREGVEGEAGVTLSPALRLHVQAAYLHATEPGAGLAQVRETRRPKWSGAIVADGERGRFSYGALLAYTGARTDQDFDFYPAQTVRLGGYALASARVGYRVAPGVEVFGRVANAFDQDYRDVVGYRPSGRSVDGGIRLAMGR
jgi:vitamin B12 transporter